MKKIKVNSLNIFILDIDECLQSDACPSDASCVNTVGSYNCVCNNNGYNYNGTSCIG